MEPDTAPLVVVGDERIASRFAKRFREPPPVVDVDSVDASLEGTDCVVCVATEGTDWRRVLDRTRDADPDAPFVLVPAEDAEPPAAEALAAGVDEYLPAMVDDATLRERVARAVTHARSGPIVHPPIAVGSADTGGDPAPRGDPELRAQNERLEEFASVISHDLRNPLAVAAGSLQLYRQTGEEGNLDRASTALDRMSDLLEELLTLAREGQSVADLVPVSLAVVARRAWDSVTVNGARLVVETDAVVLADGSRLQELLENLFSNAIEHAGADVTVRVSDHAEGFCVEDDGPGIPPEKREAVFASGFSTSPEGTGFGLAIVERIGSAHGWTIRAGKGDLEGACFVVSDVERVGP